MANSTQMITDLGTVITSGPQGNTAANAVAAAGPMQDYIGNLNLLVMKCKEMREILIYMIGPAGAGVPAGTQGIVDSSGDATNLALLAKVMNNLT